MAAVEDKGGFDEAYHKRRVRNVDLKHRINKRVDMIRREIPFAGNLSILDVGCADGLVLHKLNEIFNFKRCVGLDNSKDLMKTNNDDKLELIYGDANKRLELKDEQFDVIINTAVIEHIDNKSKMLSEFYRVLKKQGLMIITEANPFYCKVGLKLGYFKIPENTLTMKELEGLLTQNKFKIKKKRYFGLNPFFKMPFEYQMETVINNIGLGFLISNQIIVAQK